MGAPTHIPPPMIFVANLLSISINVLLLVFVIVCLLMALLILMQRPKQEGLGAAFGGGVTDQVFGARTTNVLQKGTVYLGSLFFILSLTLAILIGKQSQQKSLLDPKKPVAAKTVDADTAKPEAPVVIPTSLADELPTEVSPVEPATESVEEPTVAEEVEVIPAAEPVPEAPAVEENEANKPE
jgi:preprotein translocase subunit SecG